MGPMISERFWAPQSLSTSAKAKGKEVPGEIRKLSPVLLWIEARQRAWATAMELQVSAQCQQKVMLPSTW
jgi:hypothetical protein